MATKSKKPDEGIISGVIVLALGVLFLINNVLDVSIPWSKYWPVLLIVAGLAMLAGKLRQA